MGLRELHSNSKAVDEYIFVEQDANAAQNSQQLKIDFPVLASRINL